MEELTVKQRKLIEKMYMEDYEVGHLQDDYDEIVETFKEDDDFNGVEEEAAEYYISLYP